ncbi:MAG TPA: TonB-dependent receptor [Mariprofundaceae bacterium]|nr:TonB-dependent receptor [Mariprofundaceae bacterium]
MRGGRKWRNTLNPFNNKTIKQTALLGILASQMMTSQVQAQDGAQELDALVVTAGRIAENPANVSAATTVISSDDIEASQATTVVDILRTQVGIDVANSGGLGKTTSVFLRGGSSGQTLVLIDGVRVGSATTGSFNWANLSTADIERIEIVRGAQSSLYGADAMAGVIQIFTKTGKKGIQTHVFAEAGTYGTKSGGVSVQGGSDNGVTYALSADTLSTDGFSVAANGTEADAYKRTTLSGRVGFQAGDADIALSVRNVTGTTDLDGGFPFGDVLNFTQETTQTVSSVKVAYTFSDTFESTVQLSRSVDDSVGKDPAPGSFNNSDFKTTSDQLTLQNHWDLDTTSVLFGLDAFTSGGKSDSAGFDKSITQNALFASVNHDFDVASINASVRYDDNSVSDNQTTYKLGAVYQINDQFRATANYGTGFKAPSINDLYFPASAFSAGNANLKAETSKGWDVGVSYQTETDKLKIDIGLTWFSQAYENLIVWAPDANFFYSPSNVGEATTKGTELTLGLRNDFGFLRASWTTLEATDDTNNLVLARRAKSSDSITLGTDVVGIHAEIQQHIVGKRFSDTANNTELDAYSKTDLRLSYVLDDTWKFKFRVENLTDETYEEVSGYAVAGRSTYAGVNATF